MFVKLCSKYDMDFYINLLKVPQLTIMDVSGQSGYVHPYRLFADDKYIGEFDSKEEVENIIKTVNRLSKKLFKELK